MLRLITSPAKCGASAARALSRSERDTSREDSHPAAALETGIFTTGRMIGETVTANEPLGVIGVTDVVSPVAGRICGLQRTGRAVVAGAVVADIASKATTQVSGCGGKTDQLIARGVALAIEMEFAGWTRFPSTGLGDGKLCPIRAAGRANG